LVEIVIPVGSVVGLSSASKYRCFANRSYLTEKRKVMENLIYTSTATVNLQGYKFMQNNTEIQCEFPIKMNWAFLDMQNFYKGVQENGWKVNWTSFREHLKEKYGVSKAVVFMGYIKKNAWLYRILENAGFELEFRTVNIIGDKVDGGNVDADLASYVMDHKGDYDKAIIVADDGDYCRTIESLAKQDKLKLIISSHSIKKTSRLIKGIVPEFIVSVDSIKQLIEYKE